MPPTDLMKKYPSTNSYVNLKLVLIGNASVGKSSLLLRLLDDQQFPEKNIVTVLDLHVHKMVVNGQKVRLNIWDTVGQERFNSIRRPFYRGAQGIILVYDVSDRGSFEALPKWFSEVDPHVSIAVPKIIVGNKVDQEDSRQVSTTEGSTFASRQNALFVEASARTAVGVREIFEELVAQILETPELWAFVTPETVNVLLAKSKEDGRSWRCAC
ncbi:ras-domain-containing protein [Suillus paluster]|uniref:ras-domain-containing protein n=1 Tax=Suillus paluster TaxID=48578 RepID=UPI001B86DDE6|nr:ras-domain-containing protein [Suillus paluster]KAG1739826.1 ras-domain-containing protein [Suillus paluster]